MLSRIGESLFWIGRYVERSDDTARLLEVQTQLLIEDATSDESHACSQLLAVMGVEDYDGPLTRWAMLDVFATNPDSPSSIASVITLLREAARSARETISTDIWSAINATWQGVPAAMNLREPEMFAWVRGRTSTISGIAQDTMSRDEGWQYYRLGRSIERADMTARLLSSASASSTSASSIAWQNTLRACGGYESYLRTYRGVEADRAAAEYLLLDRWFPRSMLSSLMEAERSLSNLERNSGRRTGFSDEAQRLLGRARTELEYRPLSDILANLPFEMERMQRSCAAASDAVTTHYFKQEDWHTWQGLVTL